MAGTVFVSTAAGLLEMYHNMRLFPFIFPSEADTGTPGTSPGTDPMKSNGDIKGV
jgi:hypothetical protein